MQVPRHIFREYDVRGLVEQDLWPETVEALGRGIASYVAERGGRDRPVLSVGRDVRPSSDRLQDDLTRGLTAAGADVIDIGVVPTPVQYFSLQHLRVDGGVMITGSHNPSEYNGFKISLGTAPLMGDEIQSIRARIEDGSLRAGSGSTSKQPVTSAYIDAIRERVRLDRVVTVVVDPANATGALFASTLLEQIGCRVIAINDHVDGTFPAHHPDPAVEAHLVDLIARVRSERAAAGFGLDGDCDRLGAVDDTGRIVRGDQLVALLARRQLELTPGAKILFDVKCSRALVEDIRAHGGRPVMWKTGHSLLKRKMHEDGIPFGGEMSGHLFFNHGYFGFDDALYAACLLAQLLARSDRPLSSMVDELADYPSTPELRLETTEERKWTIVEAARRHFAGRGESNEVDGIRVDLPEGWFLLRTSNTQPVVVLRIEGRDVAALEALKEEVGAFLRGEGIQELPWESTGVAAGRAHA
ncbi:MAG: phosphomannomutase/phosphoglucomutase [Gemmatimonadetes bacterium]|nr:phosphomannomutase/phosphoglucomutase [Gemmatimonadota bacterium]